MNKFDKKYDIRLARYDEINEIMKFIKNYWRQDHIMATDRKLFEYEFLNNDTVNMIIAKDKTQNDIEGIFGFLECSQSDSKRKDVWGSFWKTTPDSMPLLGIELAKRVYKITNCRMHIGNGANPTTTIPLRKLFFKEKTTRMKQYYRLNPLCDCFHIAHIAYMPATDSNSNETAELRLFHNINEVKSNFDIEQTDSIPYKDSWYINKRFFNHPYYQYKVYGVQDKDDRTMALLIAREVVHNNVKILRIVDYLGEQNIFSGLYDTFDNMLKENNYEYIDFFEFGFDDHALKEAGFTLRLPDDKNIIPNYFEPFVQKNTDIWCHYIYDGTLFFKADGDQDRPNISPAKEKS